MNYIFTRSACGVTQLDNDRPSCTALGDINTGLINQLSNVTVHIHHSNHILLAVSCFITLGGSELCSPSGGGVMWWVQSES